ncbi:hypothetical protein CUT44_16735 [Streptomyces carminius]|uniref:Uncharacterized protein n=1 Tax=Streptomyces carminius TaxID=2665496 RepID=A0A2M8LXJ2_9ACTN|nr:hypothetical protein [Streptomyces carminius]PJE96683.1 hypothetical protein CUT44_16735 [Streptomyces carminius]
MEIDPGLCLDVPEEFDDSDAETRVHPVARKLFHATTAADVFRKAAEWVAEQKVFPVDVSWDFLHDEDEPYWLSLYFVFEQDSDDS